MFKRCTEIDATYVQAHLELFRLHRESQAAPILSDAIKANPDNVELRLAFGHWLLNNGNVSRHGNTSTHTTPPPHACHTYPIRYIHCTRQITWLHFSGLANENWISFRVFCLFYRTSTCRYADIPMDTWKGRVEQACDYWYLQVNAKIGSMVAIAFANVEVGRSNVIHINMKQQQKLALRDELRCSHSIQLKFTDKNIFLVIGILQTTNNLSAGTRRSIL